MLSNTARRTLFQKHELLSKKLASYSTKNQLFLRAAASPKSFLPSDIVKTRVLKVLQSYPRLSVDPEQVTERSTFSSIGIDATETFVVWDCLGEEFAIRVPTEQRAKLNNVQLAVEYLTQNPMAK